MYNLMSLCIKFLMFKSNLSAPFPIGIMLFSITHTCCWGTKHPQPPSIPQGPSITLGSAAFLKILPYLDFLLCRLPVCTLLPGGFKTGLQTLVRLRKLH